MFSNLNKSTFNRPQATDFGFGNSPSSKIQSFGNASECINKSPTFGFLNSSGFMGNIGQQSPFQLSQPSTSGNVFKNMFCQNVQLGTVLKYVPVMSTDIVQKAGLSDNIISTKLNCISCMREYEDKSFEELRCEDYEAGRKSLQPSLAGDNSFKPTTSTVLSSFNPSGNRSCFGQNTPTAFNMNNQTNSSFLPKINSTCGTNKSFGFGSTTQMNSFSSAYNTKPFTTSPSVPAFGTSLLNQNTSLNKNNTFSQPNNSGMFGTQQHNNIINPTLMNKPNFNHSNAKLTQNSSASFQLPNQSVTTPQSFGKFFSATSPPQSVSTSENPFMSSSRPVYSNPTIQQQPYINKQPGLFGISNSPGIGSNLISSCNQPNQSLRQELHVTEQQPIFDSSTVMQLTSPFGYVDQFKGLMPLVITNINETLNISNIKTIYQNSTTNAVDTEKVETVFRVSTEKPRLDFFDLEICYDHELKPLRRMLRIRNKEKAPSSIVPKSNCIDLERIDLTNKACTNECVKLADTALPLNKTEIVNKSVEANVTNTCGVTLTRVEYYTIPPLDELHKYCNKSGKCVIKGFTIGRIGYGNVYFIDEVDVTNLNLDQIIHFRNREVTIYPDDTTKPPFGHGLNKPAQITLDRIYPVDKNKNIISDVNMLVKINFADRLKKLCEQKNFTFKEYRPETGSWVFTVEHI